MFWEIMMSDVIQWINEKIINDGTTKIEADDIDEIRDVIKDIYSNIKKLVKG